MKKIFLILLLFHHVSTTRDAARLGMCVIYPRDPCGDHNTKRCNNHNQL